MLNWWGIGSAYQESPAIGWTLITFVIFILIIRYFIKQPLAVFLATRSQMIEQSIEEAKKAKIEAAEKLRQCEQRLLALDAETAKIKADFERQGELERARLKTEAEKIAEQIQKDTELTLRAEVSRMILKLKQDIADKIILSAQKNLFLSPEIDQKLCHRFVGAL